MHLLYKYVLQKTIQKMLFLIITIGDRYGGQISVPGGSSLRTFVLFPTLMHSNKDKKSLKALFLNFQTFLQGTHIEPVVTHFEPPSLSPRLTCSSYQGNQALSLQTVDPYHLPAFYQGGQTILKAPFLEHGYNTNREASLILPSWLDNKLFRLL